MAYTKYSLTPANNNAAPPDGAPEGMLPSAVNDTMRDMMAQIRDVGDGIRGGTYTMTAPIITGGTITGVALTGNTFTSPVISGGSINNTPIGATTASTGRFSDLTDTGLTSGRVIYAGTGGNLVDDADFTFNGTTVTMANDASISGLTVGKGGSAVLGNTALGLSALAANTTGSGTTAIGYQALKANTTGIDNVAVGLNTLYLSTTGNYNVGVGRESLNNNTTGSNNSAFGHQALNLNTTASNNTAVGYQAGYSHTTGTGGNTFLGRLSGYSTTGNDNTFVGNTSGYEMTTGTKNTIIGSYNGNQDGLDIRTLSNRAVISDGDGNIKCYWDDIDSQYSFVTAGRSQFRTYAASNGTYANNATVDFNSMSGLIIVNNWSTGANAIWICGGGSITLISAVGGGYGTLSFTGAYRWTNTSGTTYVYSFTAIATRESA